MQVPSAGWPHDWEMLGYAGMLGLALFCPKCWDSHFWGKTCWDLGFSPKKLTNKLTTFYKICTFFFNFFSSIMYFFSNFFRQLWKKIFNFLVFFSIFFQTFFPQWSEIFLIFFLQFIIYCLIFFWIFFSSTLCEMYCTKCYIGLW